MAPPPRFDGATFDSYRPGNASQQEACRLAREFALAAKPASPTFLLGWLRRAPEGEGLYLDGGYGVGKTHLLAAAFHAAPAARKAYLTFQELVHLVGARGLSGVQSELEGIALLCIDEFELDDPGNTLIVKRVLEHLFVGGTRVMTTSNTPPEAQGRGRFNAEDFRREIQGIAGRFRTVAIDGPDYRHREKPATLLTEEELESDLAAALRRLPPSRVVACHFDELLGFLRSLHPVRYGAVLSSADLVFVRGMRQIPLQNDALRFVHFIDQLYDRSLGLRASGGIEPSQLFAPDYRHGAYQKKHERCISRLGELLSEPLLDDQGRTGQARQQDDARDSFGEVQR